MIYSKTLDIQDYEMFDEHIHVQNILNLLQGITHRYEHHHRAWEYGLSLHAIRDTIGAEGKTLLDVGGGGSVFDPAAAWLGMDVTVVDPGDCSGWVDSQNKKLAEFDPNIFPIKYIQKDFMKWQSNNKFDVVTCLSVIEHIPNDIDFVVKMAKFVKVGGLLMITTDYHESGEPQCDGHITTYNQETLLNFKKYLNNFQLLKNIDNSKTVNYIDGGDYVNGYNFASLFFVKEK